MARPVDADPNANLRRDASVQALDASRSRLLAALAPPSSGAAGMGRGPHRDAGPATERPPGLLAQLWPAAQALIGLWWQSHPLRKALLPLSIAAEVAIAPLIRRRPWPALGVAAMVGVAAALALPRRPWWVALGWLGVNARWLPGSRLRQQRPPRRAEGTRTP